MTKNLIIIFLLIFFIQSCNQVTSRTEGEFEVKRYYRLRMKIENVGNVQYGLAILPRKEFYTLEFTALDDVDYFSFNTCSSNITRYESSGLIFKKRTTKINHYEPNSIERERFCDAKIQVADKKTYTVGYIVFENPRTKMHANVVCGTKTKTYENGSSICALPEGNYMRVTFSEPVKMTSVSCNVIDGESNEFTFKVQEGYCNYLFKNGDKPENNHRLVTYGDNDDVL